MSAVFVDDGREAVWVVVLTHFQVLKCEPLSSTGCTRSISWELTRRISASCPLPREPLRATDFYGPAADLRGAGRRYRRQQVMIVAAAQKRPEPDRLVRQHRTRLRYGDVAGNAGV